MILMISCAYLTSKQVSEYIIMYIYIYIYIYIYNIENYSCPSVCLSITGGQWKRFDLETKETVSLAIER